MEKISRFAIKHKELISKGRVIVPATDALDFSLFLKREGTKADASLFCDTMMFYELV